AEQTKSDIARTAPSPWKTCPRIISTPSASTCNVNTPWDLSASARLSKRNCHAVQDRRKSGARAKSLQIEARKVHSDPCFPDRPRSDDRGRQLKRKHQKVHSDPCFGSETGVRVDFPRVSHN